MLAAGSSSSSVVQKETSETMITIKAYIDARNNAQVQEREKYLAVLVNKGMGPFKDKYNRIELSRAMMDGRIIATGSTVPLTDKTAKDYLKNLHELVKRDLNQAAFEAFFATIIQQERADAKRAAKEDTEQDIDRNDSIVISTSTTEQEIYRNDSIVITKSMYDNQPCVIKRLRTDQSGQRSVTSLANEASVLKALEHIHIVKCLAFSDTPEPALTLAFVSTQTLTNLIEQQRSIRDVGPPRIFWTDKTLPFQLMEQFLLAVAYVHEQGYIHRDLKPMNILVDSNHTVKLSDFEFAAKLMSASPGLYKDISLAGTPGYIAPECYHAYNQLHVINYSPEGDLYAAGLTMQETFTGRHPYPDLDYGDRAKFHQQTTKLGMGVSIDEPNLPVSQYTGIHQLYTLLKSFDPNKRGSATDAIRALRDARASL